MQQVKLPSGSTLSITLGSFDEALHLFQTLSKEVGAVKISATDHHVNLFKDLFCSVSSSKDVQAALWPCLSRCLYNKQKVNKDLFEDEKAREDFLDICMEVAKINCAPFTKNLYAKFAEAMQMIESFQA